MLPESFSGPLLASMLLMPSGRRLAALPRRSKWQAYRPWSITRFMSDTRRPVEVIPLVPCAEAPQSSVCVGRTVAAPAAIGPVHGHEGRLPVVGRGTGPCGRGHS